jgi:cytochrome b involved in lipid metabolism
MAQTILAAGFAAAAILYPIHLAYVEAPPDFPTGKKIRLAEVKRHGRDSEQKWVIKGTRVYDITDWIPGRPGGEVILRAVGGTIDKYWDIFSVHKKQRLLRQS